MANWFFMQNGQRQGPITSAELKERAAQGLLKPEDQVFKEGMSKWVSARKVQGLFQIPAPPPLPNQIRPPLPSQTSPLLPKQTPSRSTIQSPLTVPELAFKVSEDFKARMKKMRNLGIWLSVGTLVLVIGVYFFAQIRQQIELSRFRQEQEDKDHAIMNLVAKADDEWARNDRENAAKDYLEFIEQYKDAFDFDHGNDINRAWSRAIDYQADTAGGESARELIRRALKNKFITLTVSNKEANQIIKEGRADLDNEEARKEVEYRSKSQERNQTRTNISSNSNRTDRSAADTVDIKLVLQLQIGMTEAEVQGILGEPHEVKKIEVPGFPAIGTSDRTLVSWIYNPGGKSFIVLLFENGVLQDGGTGGFSLKHGLNLVLPKGVIGN